jgi:major membrane immunogen (membrane-anchored lipoprotein)
MDPTSLPKVKNITALIIASTLLFTGCGSQKPLSETEQAAKYGMTVERYREEKAAAARMNMSWEDHVKMIQGDSGMNHDM